MNPAQLDDLMMMELKKLGFDPKQKQTELVLALIRKIDLYRKIIRAKDGALKKGLEQFGNTPGSTKEYMVYRDAQNSMARALELTDELK